MNQSKALVCKEPELQLKIKAARKKIHDKEKRLSGIMSDYVSLKIALDSFYEKEYLSRLGPFLEEMERLRNALIGKPFKKPGNTRADPFHAAARALQEPLTIVAPGRSAGEDSDEQAELKKLYHGLAKIYHPDTATDTGENDFLTARMSEINDAFGRKDLQALKRALRRCEVEMGTGGQSSLSRIDNLKIDDVVLDEIICHYRKRIAELKKGPTCRMMRDVREKAKNGTDFFEELISGLKSKIQTYKNVLNILNIPVPA